MRVFVDTSFWFSYLVREEQRHQIALTSMKDLQHKGALLLTSDLVISETHNLILYKLGLAAGQLFLSALDEQIKAGFTSLLWADAEAFSQARELIWKYADQKISLSDAVSAVLAQWHRADAIATFDRHFALLGWKTIFPEPIGNRRPRKTKQKTRSSLWDAG